MITLYDHIQELRAELRCCYFTRRERAAVQAELAKAIAEQAELDRAFDAALEALLNPPRRSGPPRETPPPSSTFRAIGLSLRPSSLRTCPFIQDRTGSANSHSGAIEPAVHEIPSNIKTLSSSLDPTPVGA